MEHKDIEELIVDYLDGELDEEGKNNSCTGATSRRKTGKDSANGKNCGLRPSHVDNWTAMIGARHTTSLPDG